MAEMNNYYFKEMGKIPLLTGEQEKLLAAKAVKGDKAAQKKLVEANLRFVIKIANRYQGFMEIEDLINEGNMGLMHAAEKYNPASGNKFSTYAVWWIKAYIQKAIRETSIGVRFPAYKYDEMKESKWNFISLDNFLSGDEGEKTTIMSFIKDDRITDSEEEYIIKNQKERLWQAVNKLKPKLKSVIVKRFGLDGKEPMSLSEVGEDMGYSKERVRQLERQALTELKNYMNNENGSGSLAA